MKKVQLFINETKPEASFIAHQVKNTLIQNNYILTDQNPDFVIGFGGDGTLITWLHSIHFNTNAKYLGVNCGTLGFLQDFDVTDPFEFVKNIPLYKEEHLHFVSLDLETGKEHLSYYALNEFRLLDANDKAFKSKVAIEDEFLENFIGTGLIFSSQTGSTAQNISSIGSILYPEIEAIIMTPSEALVNRELRCLPKSLCIPKEIKIVLTPIHSNEIKILSDGQRIYTGLFQKITVSYSAESMTKLANHANNFTAKIRNKLI